MKRMATIFFLTLGILTPFFVFSQSGGVQTAGNSQEIDELNRKIDENKKKIDIIQKKIDEYKGLIDVERTKAVSLSNQMAILDNHISQVELDIDATQDKLEILTLQIQALGFSIQDKEKVLEKQKVIMSELVRTMHQNDQKKYIEIAAGYKNFSDFYNQVHSNQSIEQDLGRSAKAIRLTKEDLEEKKKQTEERKAEYEEVNKQLEEKKGDLRDQISVKENLLAQTKASEMTYKTLLNSLRKQYQQIESDIAVSEKEIRKKLEDSKKLEDLGSSGTTFMWPTQSKVITAQFHDSDYPFRNVFEHSGIDIRSAYGTPIKAAASGYVARARTCTVASCYCYIMLVHPNGLSTVYGHCSKISVKEDARVDRGDVIGYSGGTPGTPGAGPFVTGAHLHFEVRRNGIPVNPVPYLQ